MHGPDEKLKTAIRSDSYGAIDDAYRKIFIRNGLKCYILAQGYRKQFIRMVERLLKGMKM